jgi:hypothetical protein
MDDAMLKTVLEYSQLSTIHLRFAVVLAFSYLKKNPASISAVLPAMSKWLVSVDAEENCSAFMLATATQLTTAYTAGILRDALRSPSSEKAMLLANWFAKS